ncbi:MAG: siderophore-interacting protein [Bdellovibrionales bacterium]|nr:siderophore-interacting protein [Bdellovibrionales bacterium]
MKKFISNLLVKYLIRKSTVLDNVKIGEDFQLLTIKLAYKKNWSPGQKIQIKVTPDELRSYTPSKWDKDKRTFQTMIYNHRSGPGALWSEAVRPQSHVQVVGPRNSLDTSDIKSNVIFFGDETTFGLAYALKHSEQKFSIKCLFEATKYSDSLNALTFLNLEEATLFERTKGDAHLKLCVDKIVSTYSDEFIILSGKKTSIQFVKDALNENGISSEKIIKKRYWGWKDKDHKKRDH